MRYRILIVDDEQDVVNVLQEMLLVMGYSADGVTNGIKAIELVKNKTYDLVIADLIMPGKTGLDLLREIKAINRKIPVVVTAGVNLEDTDIDFIKDELADFIKKPFTFKDIETKIIKYLPHHKPAKTRIT